MAVYELDDEELGRFVHEQGEYLGDEQVVPLFPHRLGALDGLANTFDQLLLLVLQFAGKEVGMDKEEVVADGVAFKKDAFEGPITSGVVAETYRTAGIVGACPVHDQPIDDIGLGQVRWRLVDPEHVFAEETAVTLVVDPLR